jgi:hypothetical protein
MPRRIQRPGMFTSGDGSTLSLDFTSGVLDPRFTFTRSTTATFINSSGYVESIGAAASNDPTKARFDYDPTTLTPRGLLSEGSASNLLSYSQDFSNAAWTKSNTNGSMTLTGTAPDNTATSRLLEENTTSYAKHSLERSISISAGIHTFSVWLKEPTSNSRRYAHIQLADGQGTAARYTIVADLQTGTITASGVNNGTAGAPTGTGHSITAYPNGWYRVTISMNHVSSPSYPSIVLGDTATLFGGNNQPFYSATTPYKGFIVWGAQLEAGSGASSYIPTTTSSVQRAADSCTILLSSFGFSTTAGTLYADWYRKNADSGSQGGGPWSTDYASARWLGVQNAIASNTVSLSSWSGSTNIANGSTRNKAAATYGAWTGSVVPTTFCVNNSAVTSANRDFNPSTATYLTIGAASSSAGSSPAYGVATRDWLNNSIRVIKYWPSILPDATIQSLTA